MAGDVWSDNTELPTKRVLILYTHRVALPITQQWDKGIRSSLQAELKQPVTIDVEYVDSDRLGGKEAIEKWFELLLLKYTATPPDLIIPVFDPTAVAFANHAQILFPDPMSFSVQTINELRQTRRSIIGLLGLRIR